MVLIKSIVAIDGNPVPFRVGATGENTASDSHSQAPESPGHAPESPGHEGGEWAVLCLMAVIVLFTFAAPNHFCIRHGVSWSRLDTCRMFRCRKGTSARASTRKPVRKATAIRPQFTHG